MMKCVVSGERINDDVLGFKTPDIEPIMITLDIFRNNISAIIRTCSEVHPVQLLLKDTYLSFNKTCWIFYGARSCARKCWFRDCLFTVQFSTCEELMKQNFSRTSSSFTTLQDSEFVVSLPAKHLTISRPDFLSVPTNLLNSFTFTTNYVYSKRK